MNTKMLRLIVLFVFIDSKCVGGCDFKINWVDMIWHSQLGQYNCSFPCTMGVVSTCSSELQTQADGEMLLWGHVYHNSDNLMEQANSKVEPYLCITDSLHQEEGYVDCGKEVECFSYPYFDNSSSRVFLYTECYNLEVLGPYTNESMLMIKSYYGKHGRKPIMGDANVLKLPVVPGSSLALSSMRSQVSSIVVDNKFVSWSATFSFNFTHCNGAFQASMSAWLPIMLTFSLFNFGSSF